MTELIEPIRAGEPYVSVAKATTAAEVRESVRTVLRDIGRIVAPDGIDEARHIALGGFEQYVLLRGQSRHAPILLFLHGGPGSPISEMVYAYQRPWEDYFLVVNWDQRGFGRSWGKPEDTGRLRGTLNREQYKADAIELIEKLCAEFGQSKIILVGQSWGTVLALEVARARPDLLHVVVTQGLAANWLASPERMRQAVIDQAERLGDLAEAQRLRDIGPPPIDEGVEAVMRWAPRMAMGFPNRNTWHNIKGPGDGWQRRHDVLAFVSPDLSAEEFATEASRTTEQAAEAGQRYQEAMMSVLPWDAERDVGTRFDVPLVVMMGSHDWQTSTALARDYYEKVSAPFKKWIEFPHAAHALNIEQPGLSIVSLVNDVLPAVYGNVPLGAEIGAP